jgi:transmembrane sensor
MNDDGEQGGTVRAEAAQWVSRLSTLPVSHETLSDFYAWRRQDGHRAAYEEVAGVWDKAGTLGHRPDMQALADDAYARGQQTRRFRFGGKPLAAFGAACLACGVTLYVTLRPAGESYSTRVGEQSIATLEDGSRVLLDTDSAIRVRFSKDARHVVLDHGQAYFQVAHNAARPFIVDAADTAVQATGTQFDVRRAGGAVDVTLVEGTVEVRGAEADTHRLVAGDQLLVRDGARAQLRRVDTANVTAWRRGRIVLDNVRLADAIAEVNRYTRTPVRLDAGRFADERFGGSFAAGDVDSFVAAVGAVLPLKAIRDGDGTTHLTDAATIRKDQLSPPT